jgi:hypothetical protein
MSAPSGKPFDPFDLSPYAPRRARERVAPDQPALGNSAVENRSAAENRNDDSERATADPLPYAPSPTQRSNAEGERPADPDSGEPARSRPQTEPLDRPIAAKTAAEAASGADTASDVDLARLETSLQWLQREGAVGRLPRAIQLPPVSGLRPVGPEGSRARSEQFINGVRVPPSLAPERLRPPPPMRERRDNLRGPLRVLLAGMIAAPIAYYFSIGNLAPLSEPSPARETGLTSLASRLVASTEFPIPKDKLRPGEAEDYNAVISSQNKLAVAPSTSSQSATFTPAATPSQSSAPARVETPAVVQPPSPAPEQAAPSGGVIRALDPQAIKLLMQQGEQFVASGDLVTARLVYRKAAESGNAAAALALGATYDPVVLAKIGVRGMGGDVEKARSWYEKAKEYGSPDAIRRLEMLANR